MSRTLTRLRLVTGDPLLVRAGRGLVPTPRAVELRDQVHHLTRETLAILRPQVSEIDMATVEGSFTVRCSESFMERLAVPVVKAINLLAPRMCLRFEAKPDKGAQPLREGWVDLEIGLIGTSAPELRTRFLFHDRYIGLARIGHPILESTTVTLEKLAECQHVATSKEGNAVEPLNSAFEQAGMKRKIAVVVPGYPDAMRIACQSDLIAIVPGSCLNDIASGFNAFEIPSSIPPFQISAMWHPRMHADPVHRRLRNCIIEVCQQAYPYQAQ